MKQKDLLFPALAVIFCILGILNINRDLAQDHDQSHISNYISSEKLTIDGMISERPQASPEKMGITVSVSKISGDNGIIPVKGLVLLSLTGQYDLDYGDYIRFKTKLRSPHNFKNPGGYDIERKLRSRGITVRGYIADPSNIIVLRKKSGNFLMSKLEGFRNGMKELIRNNAPSPDAEIIQAAILGNQKEIPDAIMEKFNRTGTTHIIAISGFNIGIIAFFSFIIIRTMMKSSPYLLLKFNIIKISTVFAVIPIILFTFIAGGGISVVRATIMVVAFMIALLINKERDLYNTLTLAALIILVVAPYSLFDISFQLSFTAVIAILFISPVLSRFLPAATTSESTERPTLFRKLLRDIMLFVIVTVSATLGTLPLIALYFNRVSTVVLLANLAVVPVLGIITIPVCTAIVIAAPFSTTISILLIKISSFLVFISLQMIDFFAGLPMASMIITTPAPIEILSFYMLIFSIVKLLDTIGPQVNSLQKPAEDTIFKRRLLVSTLILSLSLIAGYNIYLDVRDKHSGELKTTFIDVGQGNSTLIRFPAGKKMLIDGGGSFNNRFDIGKQVLAPYLLREKIKTVDFLVLTHPHPDHLNGLLYILENFQIGEVWTNGETSPDDTFRRFLSLINEKKITHRIVSNKTTPMNIDGVNLNVLNPESPIRSEENRKFYKTNNSSITIRLIFKDTSILLPADIAADTEEMLLQSGVDLASQIMLVPHHGGYTSSNMQFLRKVNPKIAVISCGKDNTFGDPHPEVLRRYEAFGTKILRTDINGAVTITTDGKNTQTRHFK